MVLTAVILTKNEERHIRRALDSIDGLADHVIIIDSGSTDKTVEIAHEYGARVIHKTWRNYATQFNFGLEQVPEETDWVLRLDADEIVSSALACEIRSKLSNLRKEVSGVYVSRRMRFLQRSIRWGGLFPIRVLRLFRAGRGHCEHRWMDEHIIVKGDTVDFVGEIIDDNTNSLTWWTEKHNIYSSREAIDLLNLEYQFMPSETVADLAGGHQAGVKRWIKEKVYRKLPGGFRVFLYFFYRYIIRLGFLDGREARAFHVLQGFWYRYLVDMKIAEVKAYMHQADLDVMVAIKDVLGIDVQD